MSKERLVALAAGAAVLASAKLVSWIYRTLTEEQAASNARDERELAAARERVSRAREQSAAQAAVIRRDALREVSNILNRAIATHRADKRALREEIDALQQQIIEETSDRATSPYRAYALRREYVRVEEARARLDAYLDYLHDYQQRADAAARAGDEEQLRALELPESFVPLYWLHAGKLVMVNMGEIEIALPPFGHRIELGRDRAAQQALALRHGNEFPLLIHGMTERGAHLGCVARGLLQAEHVLRREPALFTVERVRNHDAHGSLCDGLIKAVLPRVQRQHPATRVACGQRIAVHPSQYDLLMKCNPFQAGQVPMEVSEFDHRNRDRQQYQQLYVLADECDSTTAEALAADGQWMVAAFDAQALCIELVKGPLLVRCRLDREAGVLHAESITLLDTPRIGTDLSFRFTFVPRSLAADPALGWPYGVDELVQFSLQASRNLTVSQLRQSTARFHAQWKRAIEYQRRHEELADIEFDAAQAHWHDNELTLRSAQLAPAMRDRLQAMCGRIRELRERSGDRVARHVQLHHWDEPHGQFIVPPAMATARPRSVELQGDELVLAGVPARAAQAGGLFRLSLHDESAALQRQQQALDDFASDRLCNPALKDILLAPADYLPVQDERAAEEPRWIGRLDDSQKRVLRMVLRERNLALVQGPPGAGKTTVIVEMLYQMFRRQPGLRVLLVSQQNAAVDNAMARFMADAPRMLDVPIEAVRIGNTLRMAEEVQPWAFDTFVQQWLQSLDDHAVQAATRMQGDDLQRCLAWRALLQQQAQHNRPHDEFFLTLLAGRNLIGATCVGLASRKAGIDQQQFDVAIIDEAGRATLPEILIPILRSHKVVLVGDHHQLPPSVAPLLREDDASAELEFLREDFLSTSFFEGLQQRLPAACQDILDRQYRMAPCIGDLVADLFYSGADGRRLFNGLQEPHFQPRYVLPAPLAWVDIKGRQERTAGSTSLHNQAEAQAIVEALIELAARVDQITSVAVITPYGAQKQRISTLLQKARRTHAALDTQLQVKVDTVDAFQGSEADVVFYSTVRTRGTLSFLLDRKRLNVACSRARLHLLFFGDRSFLQRAPGTAGEVNLFPQIIRRAAVLPSPTDGRHGSAGANLHAPA